MSKFLEIMMKKTVLILVAILFGITGKAQIVKTLELPLEMINVELPKGVEPPSEGIELGERNYLLKMPEKHSLVIKVTEDKKAIIVHPSFFISRFFTDPARYFRGPRNEFHKFQMEENERRIILWYKDDRVYCGYIYDKQFKVCQYFEKREKEWKRIYRRR